MIRPAHRSTKKVSVTNFINNLPSFIGFSNSVEDISDGSQTALSITHALTLLQSSGTNTATTLADGTVVGQLKIIIHDTDGGNSILAVTDAVGFADLDFADDGDTAMLMWTGAHWALLSQITVATDLGLIDIAN